MFKQKTVFVIGAGASAEIKFPVGEGLRSQIVQLVDVEYDSIGHLVHGDHDLLSAVSSKTQFSFEEVRRAGKRIKHGIFTRNSIDEYLDYHAGDKAAVALGKAAIVKQILLEERRAHKQLFGEEENFSFQSFEQLWYGQLFKLLNQGYRFGEEGKFFDNVTFVIFNYDRSLEFFLTLAYQTMGISADRAREICQVGSTFYHPYGLAAPLFGSRALRYGSPSFNAANLAANIRTFTEEQGSSENVKAIRDAMFEARTLVFLGFSFNETNLRLIAPEPGSESKRIFGTGFRLPKPVLADRRADLKVQLNCHSGPDVIIEDMECGPFLYQYGDRIRRPA